MHPASPPPGRESSNPAQPALFVRTARRLDVFFGEDQRFGVGPVAMNVALLVRTARMAGGVRMADINAYLLASSLLANPRMADCFGHASASSLPRFRAHLVDVAEAGGTEAFPHPREVRDRLREVLFACGGSFLGVDVAVLEASHADLSERERRAAGRSQAEFALRRARYTLEDAIHQVVRLRAPFALDALADRTSEDPITVEREVAARRDAFLAWSREMGLANTR